MAIYRANVTFDHGGKQIEKGHVVEDDDDLFILYPSRFTKMFSGGTAITDQSGGTVTAGGTVAVLAAATAVGEAASLSTTQNAIASLAAAIATINTRLDQP